MRAIGVDLHKTMFQICILEGKQKDFKRYHISDLESFKKTLRSDDLLAVEATGNSRYFAEQITGLVKEVKIVNPRKFKIISESVKKTDKIDAELIAFFLSKGMLPEVRMNAENYSRVKSLCNTRDKLVKLRTTLKNKIHNILNAHGIISKKEDFSSAKGLERVKGYSVNEMSRIELEVIIEQINHLNAGIKKLEEQIVDKGKKLKGFENITSIKGIGEKGGTILLSIIGDIEDFSDAKKLAAYFGLVPKVEDSNEKKRHGRITKRGSALGRSTLVQCTLIAIKYSEYLRSYYDKLKTKKGSGKAIIATSRKLLGIIYQTLKEDWIFEDFPNFVIKNA